MGPGVQQFQFGSRLQAALYLAMTAAGLILLVHTLFREGPSRRFLYVLVGTFFVAYFSWRETRGFFSLYVSPGRVQLQFLFRTASILRGDIAGLELKLEGATLIDHLSVWQRYSSSRPTSTWGRKRQLEREDRALEAAEKWRVHLTTRGGQRFMSARFENRDLFLPLRAALPS